MLAELYHQYLRENFPECPCFSTNCQEIANDLHHHPTRGAGGSEFDVIPLCRVCHRNIHDRNRNLKGWWVDHMLSYKSEILVDFLKHLEEKKCLQVETS